jgi:hypothetical protein
MVSVIITARNEIYLNKTIENVLENSRGEIEVIVILDGYDEERIADERVVYIHHPEARGQRQSINEGARIAKGEFIMKLDAHCAVDEGFDVKLAKDCEYDWTVIPRMYNLDINTWKPKLHKRTDYMYITSPKDEKPFRAAYYGRKQPKNDIMIDDTMCCMGPGFFMRKDRFWELGGCDEGHGSWGQQGIEVSLKAWLSGGRLVVNKNTWFAHWFRGGGGPGFPYTISGNAIDKARKHSQELWLNNKWEKQTRPLSWLINKFNPPGWEHMDKTIIYLTDNTLDEAIADKVRKHLLKTTDLPIVSVSQKPIDFGTNVCLGEIGRSWLSLYKQLLAGAERATTKYVSIAEHDCLYTKEHFDWTPPRDDTFYYNENVYLVQWGGNHPELNGMYSTFWDVRKALSQLVCDRELLIKAINGRLDIIDKNRDLLRHIKFAGEPGVTQYKVLEAQKWAASGRSVHLQSLLKDFLEAEKSDIFNTTIPNLDIRHGSNFTGPKRGKNRTYDLPYWGDFKSIMN